MPTPLDKNPKPSKKDKKAIQPEDINELIKEASDGSDYDEPSLDELENDEDLVDEFDFFANTNLIDEIADDSVKLYLHEIGKIPLLSKKKPNSLTKSWKARKKPKTKWLKLICVWWCRLPSVTRGGGWIFWI